MTVDDVKERVERIRADARDDFEEAHAREDELYQAVLHYIVAEAPSPYREVALEALKSQDIQFPRYCA